MKEKKNLLLVNQMMYLASFGPVFVVHTFPGSPCPFSCSLSVVGLFLGILGWDGSGRMGVWGVPKRSDVSLFG